MSGTVRTAARRASGARRRWSTTVAAASVPAVIATLAIVYPGVPVSQVDLNDGTVWLTNTSELKLGRYNPQVEELNAGLIAMSADLDVRQDAQDVLLVEPGRLSVVDPASVTLAAQTTVPYGAVVAMAAGTIAVTDPEAGDVWARTMASIGSLSVDAQGPDIELGQGGAAVVARDGTVLAARGDGALLRAEVTDDGATVSPDGSLDGELSGPIEQATAVGDQLVALSGRTVHTPSGAVDLSAYGDDLVLQQPGASAGTVLVAATTALLEVPLDGGAVREHPTGGSGRPAAPVVVGGCAHGAWAAATGSYLQLCRGSDPTVTDLEGITAADVLVFRVNRDVVVLNDTLRGRLWLPMQDPRLRQPNWQDIEPDEESTQDEETESQKAAQTLLAECTAQSASPSATDDEYGVRAGRTRILSVIDNDGSSDCGILAISEHDAIPADFGTLQPVYDGRALQLTTRPGASGSVEFMYTITDGRGTSAPATATVRLTVEPAGQNSAPEQVRVSGMLVEQGAQAVGYVLQDFTDPDGDDLILVSGVAEGGGSVRTRQDGEVTFQSDGSALGRQQVHLQVSDGTQTVDGELTVDVRPAGSVAPQIDPVLAVTYVDEPVVVRPLESVRSVSREPVRLAGVDEVQGATVEADLGAGTFSFTAARAGTYYVSFLVTASPQQASGLARIDVRERPEVVPPPVAVRDRALLPPGGEVTIDPLANDVDPGGSVLVLQSVDLPAESGLQAAVLGHQLLQLSSLRVLDAPVTATYTVSNGTASAVGEILIQPIPASATQRAPVVPDVTATVRTGGIVTIPVLEGAYDPDGDALALVRDLAEPLAIGQGLLFVSGDVLRYQAPATPMDVHATFAVTDPAGNVTAATVTVSVHASDPATKPLPRPVDLTARVFEGETIRIPIPLTGIDPDGDGVYLLGQDQAPAKGRIVAVGADWMEYEALPGELGTDVFTYAVEDWVGQRAVATIRVGIAARPTTSAQVVARNDDVTVRPGRSVEVRVLANDADTGGGELTLEPDLALGEGVDAHVEGRRVVVQTPDRPGVLQIGYTAANARGGRGSAVLTVTVTADAPILPPIARDIVVPASETINRTVVEVDVLELAENPSGPMGDLAVSVDASATEVATVTPDGNVLVTLIDRAQTLPYVLTNTSAQAAGMSSYAFITVPALGDFPPILRPGTDPLVVIAGEQLEISLDEQIQVAPGRTVRITDAARVQATKADGSSLVKDERTLRYRAERTYAGPASISFEVSDGVAGDLSARTKVMTLPITVLAAEDYPPTFVPSVIDVAPGESARVDLTAFTSAPVGTAAGSERYTYRLTSELPSGFEIALEGSLLTVSAATTVPKGTAAGVGIEIGYGVAGTMPARVDFRVVASTRQLARVLDVDVPTGVEGGSSTVSALDGAFNPFPGEDLTLVSATVETPGAGTASVAGSQVTVRPAAGYIGPMVTRFRVRDVTGDPDREVEGRITVTVRGRPAAPTAPRVGEVRDQTVVLSWDAPVNNGEPITGYRVTAQPGSVTRECASTTCTIDNLTNDTEYTFTVQAKNAVDWSEPSPASTTARPDAVPAAPGTPTLSFGNRSVTASWAPATSTGSPVTGYLVTISPAPGSGPSSFETSSTSLVIGGLSNGTAYAVQVRATSSAPEPGPWSSWSEAMTPAAAPDAPTVTATRVQDELGGKIDVAWTPGSANGDAIMDYELVVSGGPGAVTVYPLTTTTYPLTGAANGVGYVFEVRARNKAGFGAVGGAVASTYGVPMATGTVSAVASTAGDRREPGQGTVRLSWPATDDNGSTITQYVVRRDDGTEYDAGTATSIEVTGLVGGQTYAFQVLARNAAGPGAWSPMSVTVKPITKPDPFSITFGEPSYDSSNRPTSVSASWAPILWGGADSRTLEYQCTVNDIPRGWSPLPVDSTSAACSGLVTIGRTVAVQMDVRARTPAGTAEASTGRQVLQSASEPDPVASLDLSGDSSTTYSASWSPGYDGGTAITGYQVRYRVDGEWTPTTLVTSLNDTYVHDVALVAGDVVVVEVRAVNVIGVSDGRTADTPVPEPVPTPTP